MLDGVVISLLLGQILISYFYCSFKNCLISFLSLCDANFIRFSLSCLAIRMSIVSQLLYPLFVFPLSL